LGPGFDPPARAECSDLLLNVGHLAAENALEASQKTPDARRAGASMRLDRRPRKANLGARMLLQEDTPLPEGPGLPLMTAADLQDDLMVVSNDMERLQGLLSDACDALLSHFYGATDEIKNMLHRAAPHPEIDADDLHRAMEHMAGAITAMQFQDMASQLIAHTNKRLRNCADRLARDAMGDDEDGEAVVEEAPLRPNPVTQDEMDAGSIELF
jgi:hypothetical protein